MIKWADISSCGQYRYSLIRQWYEHDTARFVVFILLNPSTADANRDDPTVRKCTGFARRWGYDGIKIVNLFAFRATDPVALAHAGYPVGPATDDYLQRETRSLADSIIVGWGANGTKCAKRIHHVMNLINRPVRCLRVLKSGQPAHPLMQSYSCFPQPWSPSCIRE